MQRKPNAAPSAPTPTVLSRDTAEVSDSKYRTNPQVEADLADWRQRNPKQVEYAKAMPRERLENSYFLRLMRAERQREAAREAIASRFMADEPLLQAYMVRAQKIASKMNLGAGDEAQVKAAALDLFLSDRRTNAITARKLGNGAGQTTGQRPGGSGMRP